MRQRDWLSGSETFRGLATNTIGERVRVGRSAAVGIFKSDRVSGGKTRQIMLAVFAGLAVALGSIFAPAPVQASETTENFVRESITRGLEILNSTAFSEEERLAEFRRYMLSLTDARRIASFTLGQYANRASPAEFDAFVETYTEFALALYERHLSQQTGQVLNVLGSVDRSADDSLVSAELSNPTVPDTPIINVAFRVRSDSEGNPIILRYAN